MPNHNRTVWDNEIITNQPPAERTVKLEYPGLLEKVELSFKFDVSSFVGCILDENKPIVINNERIPIELPSDKTKLKFVERSGIDVTKFVKASQTGESNLVIVNYRVREKPWFFDRLGKKDVGRLKLVFTVFWVDTKDEKPPTPIAQKYCMWHGCPVPPNSTSCPFKGGPKFITVITPETSKMCPNPSCPIKKIHKDELYCEYCGLKQPGM